MVVDDSIAMLNLFHGKKTDITNESKRRERVFKTGDPMATNFWKLTLKGYGNSNKEILKETL